MTVWFVFAAVITLMAGRVHGQTEATDENGVPMKLYPQGFQSSNTQKKTSLKNGRFATANDISPSGSPMIPAAQPNGSVQGPPPMYEIIDLGDLGYIGGSRAQAINNDGQIVGVLIQSAGTLQGHAFLWTPGTLMQDLGTLPGGSQSYAYGINDAGQVVGYSQKTINGDITTHAFLYANGQMVDVNDLLQLGSGWELGSATAINNAGQIVGTSVTDQSGSTRGFLYRISDKSIQDIGSFGGNQNQPSAINDMGQATGYSENNNYKFIGYIYTGGLLKELSVLSVNWPFSFGCSINNNDEVAGYSPIAVNGSGGPAPKATLWQTDGTILNLGTLQNVNDNYDSFAYGINDLDQIVGSSDLSTEVGFATHAFIYQDSKMYDLNNYLSENQGWTLIQANAVNNRGQIVGYGTNPQGQTHAFLLNPLPPCTALNYTGFKQGGGTGVPDYYGFTGAGTPKPGYYGTDGRAKTSAYGCALCSVASMLTSIPGFENVTPASLDQTLVNLGSSGYNAKDNMNWDAVIKVTGRRIVSDESIDITDLDTLNAYLEQHFCSRTERVILHLSAYLNGSDTRDGHFILITGRNDSDWDVFDPGWTHAWVNGVSHDEVLGSLAGHLAGFTTHSAAGNNINWTFKIDGVRTFALDTGRGGVSGIVHSPVELLVTDPSGKRVGYNQVTGSNVFEIPGSSYFTDNPIVNADDGSDGTGDTNGLKTLFVPSPVGGNYQVQLFGTGSGGYTLDLGTAWPDGGGQAMQSFTGTASPGVTTTNLFFVIGQPIISGCSIAGNTFDFTFTGQSNVTYSLQGRTALESGSWTNLQFSLQATNDIGTVSQPITTDKMFYRIVAQ